MEKLVMTAQDIAKDIGIPINEAREMIRKLNEISAKEGIPPLLKDRVSTAFYEQVKAERFMYKPERYKVPLENRLWWSLEEFVRMSDGAFSRDRAKKFLENNGLLSFNGNKQIVNVIAYREWAKKYPSLYV